MSVHTVECRKGIYFITFTCFKWLPLIGISNLFDMVYKWFDILTNQGNAIVGYVIMPNHIHLQLYYNGIKNLNTIIGNGKRFLAYSIIDRLRKAGNNKILTLLKLSVQSKDRDKGQKHEVWRHGFDIKSCRTEKFIQQKLNYMHDNPCAGKWKLTDRRCNYEHSSCSFYEIGKKHYKNLRDYRDFLVDLENSFIDESS